jgi:tripartite-type tricarboxylate transporter receptor subunit TctC
LTISSLALLAVPSISTGQDYPNHPVKVICSFPPGGGTDFLARLVAQKLSERWGQPVVVENRPGGNGTIGGRAAMSAQPDGYTLYVGSSDHMVLAPNLFTNLPYDTVKDFVPVVSIANQYVVLVVNPVLNVKTVAEFIALANSMPGQVNYSSSGNGTVNQIGGELFQHATRTKLAHIPYKGSAPAIADLLSGQDIKVSFAAMASIVPHIKSGKVRALAISAPNRSPALPDVPTGVELGYPDFVAYSWNGIFVPVGTAPEIVRKINADVVSILRSPDVVERLASVGVEPVGGTPEQFAASIKADLAQAARVIKGAGIDKTPM